MEFLRETHQAPIPKKETSWKSGYRFWLALNSSSRESSGWIHPIASWNPKPPSTSIKENGIEYCTVPDTIHPSISWISSVAHPCHHGMGSRNPIRPILTIYLAVAKMVTLIWSAMEGCFCRGRPYWIATSNNIRVLFWSGLEQTEYMILESKLFQKMPTT